MGFFDSGSANTEFNVEETLALNLSVEIPEDTFQVVYIAYFILGTGYLLPWNAFITAVDYFSYLYPGFSVDRVFAVTNMFSVVIFLLIVMTFFTQRSSAFLRINVGLVIFLISLLIVPLMDGLYLKGRTGLYEGYYVTVASIGVSGVGNALVQGSLIGCAGELPDRYMQAVIAGTAASGVLASAMRLLTKAMFQQDAHGLRKSANLYFGLGIIMMFVCLICYNMADRLPIIQYYKKRKLQAALHSEELENINEKSSTRNFWAFNLWHVLRRIKYFGFGILLIYIVTLSIFPGYLTENVHSALLGDWYSIILITTFNVFDLVGKSLTAAYVIQNTEIAVGACVARLLFYPLFYTCLHGPALFRSELPVTLLTCMLGLTNGYFTSVLMMTAPKILPIQEAETAGLLLVLFLVLGSAIGSAVGCFWAI